MTEFIQKKKYSGLPRVYLIPYSEFTCELKKRVISILFPEDTQSETEWLHKVKYTGKDGETLWRIAEWFTGSGLNASIMSEENQLSPEKLSQNTIVHIPGELLLSCFAPPKQSGKPEQRTVVGDLTFSSGPKGKFAEYRLKKGQAIYTDVVLKFTPRVTSTEVLEAAGEILKFSDLKSFHDIPADTTIKIPLDLLSPEYLPVDDPRRIQYEKTAQASLLYKKTVSTTTLEGVTVVLDSGHGGVDPGTIGLYDTYEDEYVYDISCRVKDLLESQSKAKVKMTLQDLETGYKIRKERQLSSKKNKEQILTTPPYIIEDASTGLNMRMFLSNYLYEQHCDQKNLDEKCVFLSIHADSLHPNAQGVMVYIPGADYYLGSYSNSDKVYTTRKEIKGKTKISMTRQERLKAQGFSQSLASEFIRACSNMSVTTHSNQPIRKYIVRNKKSWVPFVLKYCKIPTRILIEVANLKNSVDCDKIRDPDYRQKLAESIVLSIKNYYKNSH